MGYSPWGHKESNTTERLTLSLFTAFILWRSFSSPQMKIQAVTFSYLIIVAAKDPLKNAGLKGSVLNPGCLSPPQDCCKQEGCHGGEEIWLDNSLSPFAILPPPHRLPVFPMLPLFKMEDREEIRGTEKLLPKRYFLDFILVSSETTSITRSLSMETRTVILWLVAYSFLEHSTSQGGSRDPREFLRPFQGGCKVKTTFIMILRCAVPFSLSFSHECTVCFKETIVCCC